MDTVTQLQPTPAAPASNNAFARLDLLFSQLPDHVYDWLFSAQGAKNVVALGKKFMLSDSQIVQISRLTGMVILKEITMPTMALELKKTLGLDDAAARRLSLDIALAQFLPIRDHLPGVENFIAQLGGALPTTLPPLLKITLPTDFKTAPNATRLSPVPNTSIPAIVQKTLKQLAQENKETLNQNLTGAPIKVAEFDQPVRPTIKNWLVDYVKIKGAGHHDSLTRSDYLFNSPNTRDISDDEKNLVSEILKAYDDDLPLPVNTQDNTVLLDKLAPTPNKQQTAAASTAAPPKPRLSGNIIDLSDISHQ